MVDKRWLDGSAKPWQRFGARLLHFLWYQAMAPGTGERHSSPFIDCYINSNNSVSSPWSMTNSRVNRCHTGPILAPPGILRGHKVWSRCLENPRSLVIYRLMVAGWFKIRLERRFSLISATSLMVEGNTAALNPGMAFTQSVAIIQMQYIGRRRVLCWMLPWR
jgi:hypothetical protein